MAVLRGSQDALLRARPELIGDDALRLIGARDPLRARPHDPLAFAGVGVLAPFTHVPVHDAPVTLITQDHANA